MASIEIFGSVESGFAMAADAGFSTANTTGLGGAGMGDAGRTTGAIETGGGLVAGAL